jgi:hypothetical protein
LKFKYLAVPAFFKNLLPVIVQERDLPAAFPRGMVFYRTVNRGCTTHNFTARAVVIIHNMLFPDSLIIVMKKSGKQIGSTPEGGVLPVSLQSKIDD